jgi:hypothetical protein
MPLPPHAPIFNPYTGKANRSEPGDEVDVGLELGEVRYFSGITLELSGDHGKNTFASLREEDGIGLGFPTLAHSKSRHLKINVVTGSEYGVGDDVPIAPGKRGVSVGLVGNAQALVTYGKLLRTAGAVAGAAAVTVVHPAITDKKWEGGKLIFRCSKKVAVAEASEGGGGGSGSGSGSGGGGGGGGEK